MYLSNPVMSNQLLKTNVI